MASPNFSNKYRSMKLCVNFLIGDIDIFLKEGKKEGEVARDCSEIADCMLPTTSAHLFT